MWEGRYKASPVGGERYFLTVSRYIELNPVRANMVALPEEYPWSSYRHNAMGTVINLIREHEYYQRLGRSKVNRMKAYRELFGVGLSKALINEIRLCTNKKWIIGSDIFKQQIERH